MVNVDFVLETEPFYNGGVVTLQVSFNKGVSWRVQLKKEHNEVPKLVDINFRVT